MKVIHVLKKIEQVDEDIKELRKMEKSLHRNKSFSTPIFMTIEKQINILLGDRIKLLELKIDNPPEHFAKEFDAAKNEVVVKPLRKGGKPASAAKRAERASTRSATAKGKTKQESSKADTYDDDEIPMMTQDMIDSRFDSVKESPSKRDMPLLINRNEPDNDDDVKLLDIALEKGTLNKEEIDKARGSKDDREKKRVRFFRDNFPGSGSY